MFKKNELRLLWPFYLMVFMGSCSSVALPVWIIFFQHKFTFIQISIALSAQSLASILFEIPTGAIADMLGRKFSVVLGITLQGLLWLALPFIDLSVPLYFAFFLMGTFRTLESGADNAWIVDWLNCNSEGRLMNDMFIKFKSLSSAGLVLSSLLSSLLLFFFELKDLFLIQGCGYLLVSLVLFFFTKENIYKKPMPVRKLFRGALYTSKEGVGFLFNSKALLFLIPATAFAICSKDFGCIAWQPLLVDLSMPDKYIGIVFSIVSLTGIITPFFSKKLLRVAGCEKYYLAFTTAVEFVILISLYFIDKPFFGRGIIVYMLVMIIANIQSPVGSLYFQSFIPSKIRATMGSVQSMILALFSFISTIAGGYAIDKLGLKTSIIYFSFLLIPAGVFYLLIENRAKYPLLKINLLEAV